MRGTPHGILEVDGGLRVEVGDVPELSQEQGVGLVTSVAVQRQLQAEEIGP